MVKFINIDNDTVINVNEIEGIQRELFDVNNKDFIVENYYGEEVEVDCRSFHLANIFFINGKLLEVNAVIYTDRCYVEQVEEKWIELIKHLDSKLLDLY